MFTAHCAFDILRHPKERLNTAHDIGKRPIASWTGAAAVKKLWRLSQPRSLQDDHSVPPHQLGLLLLRVA